MASPGKFRAHEALNLDAAGLWNVVTEQTVTATTKNVTVWRNDNTGTAYHTVHLQTSEDIYFLFATTTTDQIDTDQDLYLMGGDTIYSLKIPHGLAGGIGTSIVLQMQRKTSASSTVRVVRS